MTNDIANTKTLYWEKLIFVISKPCHKETLIIRTMTGKLKDTKWSTQQDQFLQEELSGNL